MRVVTEWQNHTHPIIEIDVKHIFLFRWCLDPTPAAPGESYSEDNALGAPLENYDPNNKY